MHSTPDRTILVPILSDLSHPSNRYEHTPLDYYRYGEYPRFIRPVRASRMSRRAEKGGK